MTAEARAFATEIVGRFHGPEDRAWTTHHHPGQLTVSDYRRLDLIDPREITAVFRVKTRATSNGVYEYLGTDADGWLVRAELDTARYTHKALPRLWAQYLRLPYLRLVDEVTGYSHSDPNEIPHRRSARGAKVVDVPPPRASLAHPPMREDDQDEHGQSIT